MLHTTTLTTADGAGDAYGPRCRVSVAVARWSRSTQMRYIEPGYSSRINRPYDLDF